jgi:2-dehydropantoate 2-reductase
MKMKIAVVGCGALGSFYGARLLQSGQEVHFLLRSDYETVQREGVRVLSPEGDFQARPDCTQRPEEIGKSDLILIGLKTTANHEFPRLLPAMAGPETIFLTLQNGLGNEAQLAGLFGPENVLGGNCFVCLNRVSPGIVQHLAYGKIVLGEYQRPPLPRTGQLCELFRRAGVECEVTPDLERARWEKLVWNIPFNGLGVASSAGYAAVVRGSIDPDLPLRDPFSTEQLLADPGWEQLVRELMQEVIRGAEAAGFELSEQLAEKLVARTRRMGAYKASTLLDFERGHPLELEALFFEPLRQARRSGMGFPRLEALCGVLRELERGTQRRSAK